MPITPVSFQQILIQSVYETVVPKLVAEDIPLLQSLLSDVFPGVRYVGAEMQMLKSEIKKVCAETHLVYGEGEEQGFAWVEKVGLKVDDQRQISLCNINDFSVR